jgi:hypothetical protein
MLTWGIEGY